MLLKKFCGEEGEKVDVQKLFGYIGLFTLVALWWLGKSCLIIDAFLFLLLNPIRRFLHECDRFLFFRV